MCTSRRDTDTKTILVDQRYVMGFAGLGRVREDLLDPLTGEQRRTRVETWVTSALAPVDPTHYFDAFAEQFGPVCEAQGWNRPHQFVAVGYRTNGPFGAADPELVIVRNSQAMMHQFEVYRTSLGDDPFILQTESGPVSARTRRGDSVL